MESLESAKAASGMAAISMVCEISAVIGIAMIGTISEVIGNMADYAVCGGGRGHCYGKPVQEHNSVQPPFETGFGFRKFCCASLSSLTDCNTIPCVFQLSHRRCRCRNTSGLRGLPRSARAAPPFKCRPHQCRRHLLPHFLGSTTSLALHHPHHIRWPLNHSYVTTRAHFLKRPLPPLAIPHSRSELKNGRGMFFSRFKSFTHSRC